MKSKLILFFLIFLIVSSCVGSASKGVFGTGVSVAFDPRSLGTQIDDSIMQKNLITRLTLKEKSYFLKIKTKVLDGRIFLTGNVDDPEEKLQITKLAWETDGVRSVKNDIKIKEKFNFKRSAKDALITSQLKTAMIFNKKINKAIEPIKNFFSGRKILICREISKFYEEYLRTNVDDLKTYEKIPKGELTIVISEKNRKKKKIVQS